MDVQVADKKGFCVGVEHAIALARRMLEEGKQVYCLGPLIHNKQVVDRLAQQGLRVVESVAEIPWGKNKIKNKNGKIKNDVLPKTTEFKKGMRIDHTAPSNDVGEPPTVLIRSHGCRPELIEQVKARGLRLADATCILVKRVQKLISTLHKQGYQVVIVGDPEHPEVEGTVGYAPNVIVVKNESDLDRLPARGKVAVVSQTTFSAADFDKIASLIAKRNFEEIKIVNTICRETTLRQASAVELCRQVDVMFVLGSHHSANTGELAHLCRRQGVQTYHLQNWSEFKPEYIADKKVAGVTAGASTPDWVIEEFVNNLRAMSA